MKTLIRALLAVILGLIVVISSAALLGRPPLLFLRTLVLGAVGSQYAITETFVKSVPLMLTALSVLVAFRAGVWNIGAEGQFLVGAVVAFVAARAVAVTGLSPVIAIIASALAGAFWGWIAIALRIRRNAPEVLSTILLNFVALHLLGWSVNGPLQEATRKYPQSEPIAESAWLPAIPSSRLHAGLLIALVAALVIHILLHHTATGLRMRAAGFNPQAARFTGIDVEREMVRAMVISGALAGMAGGIEVLAVTHRLYERLGSGYGYSGIAVALLGQLEPLGSVAAALLFGAFATGAGELQRTGQSSAAVAVALQGVVIIALLALDRTRKERP